MTVKRQGEREREREEPGSVSHAFKNHYVVKKTFFRLAWSGVKQSMFRKTLKYKSIRTLKSLPSQCLRIEKLTFAWAIKSSSMNLKQSEMQDNKFYGAKYTKSIFSTIILILSHSHSHSHSHSQLINSF